jgi:general secretion pathway protein G
MSVDRSNTGQSVGAPPNAGSQSLRCTDRIFGSEIYSLHRRSLQRKCHGRGFSLIELLIVMAIILTIAAIAIPSLMASVDAARVARAVGDINAIESDLTLYEVNNSQLPDTLAQAGDGALMDPWGNPYQYLNHATMKGNGQARKDRFLVPLNDDYDLYSMGKDGSSVSPITAKSSQDDIIRAASGSYVGLASQF